MSSDDRIEAFGSSERNNRLQRMASRLAAKFGVHAELYVDVRATTAEKLGDVQRSGSWRVVQGILTRNH